MGPETGSIRCPPLKGVLDRGKKEGPEDFIAALTIAFQAVAIFENGKSMGKIHGDIFSTRQ